ncbi:MAG: ABC transporter permease, partial [Bacteroidaceae bacterium]|nr:ABC transporter permease [Bacteroidaceae bacterium]
MRVEINIAKRLFGHRDDTRRISRPAVVIAQWGVAVGLAVMILSVCIILGFKGEIRQKVTGFGGHI